MFDGIHRKKKDKTNKMNMNRNKSEPNLMDEKLVMDAVLKKLPNAKADEIHFDEILTLNLEYRNILRVDQLWDFRSLTSLELNCNLIEKIGGLDHLVNLTWLDLSFNRIKKIQGLECLSKLELLNLNNNSISAIENMDALEKLTHFTIANNLLDKDQLDNVLHLKRFTNLYSLSLSGNPIPEDSYKLFMAAHLPKLRFLNNRSLDEGTKKEASIKYQNAMEELKQQAAAAKLEAEIKFHKDAFVEFLNGSHLFKSMIEDESEEDSLICVPGVAPLLKKFEHQMTELCKQVFEIGLAEHKRRETEVSSFLSGQTEIVTDCQQRASQIQAEFEEQHRQRMAELQQLSDPDLVEVKINHHNDEINQLCDRLIGPQLQLVRKLEDIIQMFDSNISNMVGDFIGTVQKIFAQCQDLENNYHEKIQEIVEATMTKAAKDDLPNDVQMLFSNELQVRHLVATGHHNHLEKIKERETQLVTRINAWKTALVKEIEDKTLKMYHSRMLDIHRHADHLREEGQMHRAGSEN